MMTLSILAIIINSPWYFAQYVERMTGYYPQWIVDFFGGINSGVLDAIENIGMFIAKLF